MASVTPFVFCALNAFRLHVHHISNKKRFISNKGLKLQLLRAFMVIFSRLSLVKRVVNR